MQINDDDVILRLLMRRNAEGFPHREVVSFEDGERWSALEAYRQGCAAADVLRRQGVGPGDVVGVLLPNGAAFLRTWWGAHYLGAVIVPFNLSLKGALLRHLLDLAQPKLCVTNDTYAPELRSANAALPLFDGAAMSDGDMDFVPGHPLAIGDPNVLMATSGTTGPSKLCRISAYQFSQLASYVQAAGLDDGDRFLLDLPLYHIHAMGIVRSAQFSGVPLSLRAKPSLSRYFDIIRETGATATSMVGTTAAKLAAEPERPGDPDNSLRFVLAAPLPPDVNAFCKRFGIDRIATSLGSTEIGGVIVSDPATMPADGSCGRGREHWDLRLVDENDADVPEGKAGELLIAPRHPALRSSYVANAEANAESWQDGWFRTGDILRRDAAGNYFYVDRLKDSLRRHGENISSFEVEADVRAYPGIRDVACVAARSDEGSGDEVKVWIVTEAGDPVDFAALARFLSTRMPRYMIPRYYELTPALPMTPTNKVQKHLLRARGNSDATFDLHSLAPPKAKAG